MRLMPGQQPQPHPPPPLPLSLLLPPKPLLLLPLLLLLMSLLAPPVLPTLPPSPRRQPPPAAPLIGYERPTRIEIDSDSWQHFLGLITSDLPRRERLLCSGAAARLTCPAGATVAMETAYFGQRREVNQCNSRLAAAGWQANKTCELHDAWKALSARCSGLNDCPVRAEAAIIDPTAAAGGRACHGLRPFLSVKYVCQPNLHSLLLCSGSRQIVSCDRPDQLLTVVHARHTRKFQFSNATCPDTVATVSGLAACRDEGLTNPVRSMCHKDDSSCWLSATFPSRPGCAASHLFIVYACVPKSLYQREPTAVIHPENSASDADRQRPSQDSSTSDLQIFNDQGRPAKLPAPGRSPKDSGSDRPGSVAGGGGGGSGGGRPSQSGRADEKEDIILISVSAAVVSVLILATCLMFAAVFRVRRRRRRRSRRSDHDASSALRGREFPALSDSEEAAAARSVAGAVDQRQQQQGVCFLLPSPPLTCDPGLLQPPQALRPILARSASASLGGGGATSPQGSLQSSSDAPSGYATVSSSSGGTVRFSQFSDLYFYSPNSCPIRSPPGLEGVTEEPVYTPRGVSYV